jgi:hypothetical protein
MDELDSLNPKPPAPAPFQQTTDVNNPVKQIPVNPVQQVPINPIRSKQIVNPKNNGN